jgi:hypothetical protein
LTDSRAITCSLDISAAIAKGALPMIEVSPDYPDNILAITASKTITGDDYASTIIPAIEAKLKTHDKIRLLYNLGPDFTGFDAAAMWEDTTTGLKHFTDFEKIAFVSDVDWINHMVRAFGFMIPCPVKVFSASQIEEAGDWIKN